MHEPLITVVGHVAGPPTVRTLADGVSVASFRVAATPRQRSRDGSWGDRETIWFGVSAWRQLADGTSRSLKKGDRVVVSGRLTSRTWEAENGERRSNLEIDATSVGLELSRGTAAYVKAPVLVTNEDPLVSSGHVDPRTGEVLMVAREDLEDDALEADEPHEIGELVGAGS